MARCAVDVLSDVTPLPEANDQQAMQCQLQPIHRCVVSRNPRPALVMSLRYLQAWLLQALLIRCVYFQGADFSWARTTMKVSPPMAKAQCEK